MKGFVALMCGLLDCEQHFERERKQNLKEKKHVDGGINDLLKKKK